MEMEFSDVFLRQNYVRQLGEKLNCRVGLSVREQQRLTLKKLK